MSHKVSYAQKESYLHAVVTGDNTREDVAAYLEKVRRECVRRKCPRVLIEERLEGPRLGATDVFEIVSEAAVRAALTMKKIAFVNVTDAGDDLMPFAETVATNRAVPVKMFPTVAAAEKWMKEKSVP